ncbi:dTDP-4-dehydrorhamnose 3,5-epimerase [Bdellovibrionota bacterium FG-1]
MKITDLELNGLKYIELKPHGDHRGFFVERYNEKVFAEHGIPTHFAQDNHSRSAPGILRGMHFQPTPSQGKLVGCVAGKIWDVAVDIRVDSKTFGRWVAVELVAEKFNLLWIPPGFAHGFCVLGDEPADVLYKVTTLYNPPGESGISWQDPEIGIQWPLKNPKVSERDANLQSLAQYRSNPPKWVD